MIRYAHRASDLPAGHNRADRVRRWMDFYHSHCGALDVSVSPDAPFMQNLDGLRVGGVSVWRLHGAINSGTRDRSQIARDSDDRFSFALNINREPLLVSSRGADTWVAPGSAALLSRGEPVMIRSGLARTHFLNVSLPRAALVARLPQAEDSIGRALPVEPATIAYIGQYCEFLLGRPAAKPDLTSHVEAVLLDLVTLALSPPNDRSATTGPGAANAKTLEMACTLIETHYFKPGFTLAHLARSLKQPARFLAALLEANGPGFDVRIMDLRLAYGRNVLDSRACKALDLAAVAAECGFAEPATFATAFAKRYGLTPEAVLAQAMT